MGEDESPRKKKKARLHVRGELSSGTSKSSKPEPKPVRGEIEAQLVKRSVPNRPRFPPEILERLILSLDPETDKRALSRCLRVSKLMFDLAAPLLYRQIVAHPCLDPSRNPLCPLPKGVKRSDPTVPILDEKYQRCSLLRMVQRITVPYNHVHVFGGILRELAENGGLRVVVQDFDRQGVEATALATPQKPQQGSGWALSRSKPHQAASIIALTRREEQPQIIIKFDSRTLDRLHNALFLDPLLGVSRNRVTLIYWSPQPGQGAGPCAFGLSADSYSWRLLTVATSSQLDLTVVNAVSIVKAIDSRSTSDPVTTYEKMVKMTEKSFELFKKYVKPQERSADSSETPPGKVRFLTMDQYIEQEDWRLAFTEREMEPWLEAKKAVVKVERD
ncbi:hypothetical protein BD324DRAFT_648941 [Kockovaella imperatae]|uniref:F-box domain-containing protein n=1 Tax=Kockovaella imperatae TaxID=4999 RepID=A0A1Y1ULA0_9TREE|nr:hypothetical protein BD324DRAFT_648941 [Kockovaella imperatae]ORX38828.1 hypothetical protein BD324DRAFT_648941 [Kockovaella imperatae]